MSEIRLRFAPSPTGVLHLGGARTALFNWLYAKHVDGKFLLRIEDTDKERSTDESTKAIMNALTWLGMTWDEEPVFQSQRLCEHKKALDKLIADGRVYKCYCTPEERQTMREEAISSGKTSQYDGRCYGKPDDPTKPFVWRFKMPKTGETVVDDIVMGKIATPNEEIEDLVIARSDGSPLYNFVVVIDDAAMGITHVVRGKDHLTNTPKQIQIYKALNFEPPKFAHLPLILGLSKRLMSSGIESFRDLGYLPEAVNNYIARLGWSCGDQEVFSTKELIELFDLKDVNRSEGALNMEKMAWLNHQHIQSYDTKRLCELTAPFLANLGASVSSDDSRLLPAIESRRTKAKSLVELAEGILFYFLDDDKIEYEENAAKKFLQNESKERFKGLAKSLELVLDWNEAKIEEAVKVFCDSLGIQLGEIAQPCRVALTGSKAGPGLFEMMCVLGKTSTIARITAASKTR